MKQQAFLSFALSAAAALTVFSCSGGKGDSNDGGEDSGGAAGRGDGSGEPLIDGRPATCPPTYEVASDDACDGLNWLSPELIAEQSDGIEIISGPGGTEGVRLDDTQAISLVDDPCLQLGKDAQPFSVSAWFRIVDEDSFGGAQLFGTSASQFSKEGIALYLSSTDELNVTTEGNQGGSNAQVAASGWNHVAMVYTGRALRLYVNGKLDNWEFPNLPLTTNFYREEVLKLGDYGYGERSPIDLAEIRSYPRVLSETEVRALHFEHIEEQGITTAALAETLDRIEAHVSGETALSFAELEAAVTTFAELAVALPSQPELLERAFDIVDLYEEEMGPLFLSEETQSISALPEDGESDAIRRSRLMIAYHQAIMDYGLAQEAVAGCGDTYEGRSWMTAEAFPGLVQEGAEVGEFTVQIDASKPKAFGRPVAFSEGAGRKVTGLYLPPGGIADVTVPEELVGQGFQVVVGAHTHRQEQGEQDTRGYKRLPHVAARFDITSEVTRVTNPLGGGIYIEVPYLAEFGLVDITVSGVVQAPLLSLRSRDEMSLEDWRARRTAPGPWADLVTDQFMLQVPRHWVYDWDGAIEELEKWDLAMEGVSEFFGFEPEDRNDVVLYLQTDVHSRHVGHGGIGYPQTNTGMQPWDIREGVPGGAGAHVLKFDSIWLPLEIHELGHAQRPSGFPFETEAMVNVPLVYITNTKFGVELDEAFGGGFGGGSAGGRYTIDEAAIHWMVTENFRNGAPMAQNETAYQHRGSAKYSDIARLYGWQAMRSFYRSEQLRFEDGSIDSPTLPSRIDERIFQLSIAAGEDLTPLIHFWGVHPEDPEALNAALDAEGLFPSTELESQLLHYRDLIPADNDAFNAYFHTVFPNPSPPEEVTNRGPGSYGWFYDWLDVWDTTHAELTRAALDAIISEYYP